MPDRLSKAFAPSAGALRSLWPRDSGQVDSRRHRAEPRRRRDRLHDPPGAALLPREAALRESLQAGRVAARSSEVIDRRAAPLRGRHVCRCPVTTRRLEVPWCGSARRPRRPGAAPALRQKFFVSISSLLSHSNTQLVVRSHPKLGAPRESGAVRWAPEIFALTPSPFRTGFVANLCDDRLG